VKGETKKETCNAGKGPAYSAEVKSHRGRKGGDLVEKERFSSRTSKRRKPGSNKKTCPGRGTGGEEKKGCKGKGGCKFLKTAARKEITAKLGNFVKRRYQKGFCSINRGENQYGVGGTQGGRKRDNKKQKG